MLKALCQNLLTLYAYTSNIYINILAKIYTDPVERSIRITVVKYTRSIL